VTAHSLDTSKHGNSSNYKESDMPGALFGLQLAIYVGYNEKLNLFNTGPFGFFGFTNINGLYILIENNTYLADNKQNVMSSNGGTMNYISMQRQFTSKLPKPYSDCGIDNTNPRQFDSPYFRLILNSSYQYTQDMCIIQCLQHKVIQACNCTIPIFLSLYNRPCLNDAQSLCAMDGLWYGQFSKNSIRKCIPQCPLECNTSKLTFSISSQSITGLKYASLIKNKPKLFSELNSTPISEETSSKKFVQVMLYYYSLTFTSSKDTPSMDIVAFLGSVGGTLGLFLGVSVLSVCELLHVIVESGFMFSHRLAKNQKIGNFSGRENVTVIFTENK